MESMRKIKALYNHAELVAFAPIEDPHAELDWCSIQALFAPVFDAMNETMRKIPVNILEVFMDVQFAIAETMKDTSASAEPFYFFGISESAVCQHRLAMRILDIAETKPFESVFAIGFDEELDALTMWKYTV